MDKTFIYGGPVEGDNFTDREKETQRLMLNFYNGLNTILISPRRMGKTSLVKKVQQEMEGPDLAVVYMDVYDCKDENDFYERYAGQILKQLTGRAEKLMEEARDFLRRVNAKFSFGPDPVSDFSLTLGLEGRDTAFEDILNLPEILADKKGKRVVVCIDEFQQIGEFPDTLRFQKRLRGVWQHHKRVSYCIFGSKKHLMENLFQSKRMPFYQFGEITLLEPIPTEYWVPFIQERFASRGRHIEAGLVEKMCTAVRNYSSYVQQYAYNVLALTEKKATEEIVSEGLDDLIRQTSGLFEVQIAPLTAYQMNFLRAICAGVRRDFSSKEVLARYNIGSKSNIAVMRKKLTDLELIEETKDGTVIADPVFEIWLKQRDR